MLFEVFTNSEDESEAIRMICNMNVSVKRMLKETVKSVVGESGVKAVKRILGK